MLLLLYLAGLVTELIWALNVAAIQKRQPWAAVMFSFVAPFVGLAVTAFTVVDEQDWAVRLYRTAALSAGAATGAILSLRFSKGDES